MKRPEFWIRQPVFGTVQNSLSKLLNARNIPKPLPDPTTTSRTPGPMQLCLAGTAGASPVSIESLAGKMPARHTPELKQRTHLPKPNMLWDSMAVAGQIKHTYERKHLPIYGAPVGS